MMMKSAVNVWDRSEDGDNEEKSVALHVRPRILSLFVNSRYIFVF